MLSREAALGSEFVLELLIKGIFVFLFAAFCFSFVFFIAEKLGLIKLGISRKDNDESK